MFSPIVTNPLHQKKKESLFFSEGSSSDLDNTEQLIYRGKIPKKSSLKSSSGSQKPSSKTTRWASPLSAIRLIPPRPANISQIGMEHILSQLCLEPIHNPKAQHNTISKPLTALLVPPHIPRSLPPPPPPPLPLDCPTFSGDLVILQKPYQHPAHPKWDAIIRNNLRHLPAAQQIFFGSVWTETEGALLQPPLFPEVSVDVLEDGQESWCGIVPPDKNKTNAPVGEPVNVIESDSSQLNAVGASNKPTSNRKRPIIRPSEHEEAPHNHSAPNGQVDSDMPVKRRRLQDDPDNHNTTKETSQLSFGALSNDSTACHNGQGMGVVLSAEDHGKGREHHGLGGTERDRKECLQGPRPATTDGKSVKNNDSNKQDGTGRYHNDIGGRPPPASVMLFSQANRWRIGLWKCKNMEQKGKISFKAITYLGRQLTEIDEHKERITREVLQRSKLAKAIRLFAHKTAYGTAIRTTARRLLDFFGRRYLGKSLLETLKGDE